MRVFPIHKIVIENSFINSLDNAIPQFFKEIEHCLYIKTGMLSITELTNIWPQNYD